MARLTKGLGWLLCVAGALVLVWAARGAVSQWATLLWYGDLNISGWLIALVTACLGLCVARLGFVMSRERSRRSNIVYLPATHSTTVKAP